jgi:hypothetical protein
MTDFGMHVLHVPGVDANRDAITWTLHRAGAVVHNDPDRQGLLPNWRRALDHAVREDREWTVMLSDDAMPLIGWKRHLDLALKHSPKGLLSLCHFGSVGQQTARRGYAYATGHGCLWGIAIGIHRSALAGLPRFVEHALTVYPEYPHDDGLLSAYAEKATKDGTTAMTARAIFDHADVPTLMGHGGPRDRRRPLLTIAEPGPAWTAVGYGTVNISYGPRTTRLLERLS